MGGLALRKPFKDMVPANLQTLVRTKVNPLLMTYVKQWQWRQVVPHRDLLDKTSKTMHKDTTW